MAKNDVSRIPITIPKRRTTKKGQIKPQRISKRPKRIKRPYVKYREALILNEMINIKFYSEALAESMGRIIDHKKEIEDYENVTKEN